MSDQKVLDKFTTLYQQDKVNELLEAAQMEAPPEQAQPAGEQPPPEQPAQEGGKPAEMGDFGTALKNIEGFAPIPGAEAVKSAIEPEPQKSFKDMGFMEKLKAIPGEAMKVLRQDVAGSIPTTVGQAAMMGAAGKVLKGVAGGVKAAGQAFHELPKPSEVRLRVQIRSAGDSTIAKDEYGTVTTPTPKEEIPLSKEALSLAKERNPDLVKRAAFRMQKKESELTPADMQKQGLEDAQLQTEAEASIAAGHWDWDKIMAAMDKHQIHLMEDATAAEYGYGPKPTDLPQEQVLKQLVEEERVAKGSRIVTPNDVSRAIGRELIPDEEAALKAEHMGDYTSHIFGLAEQGTAVKNKVLEEISKFRGGQLESEEQIAYFFQNYVEIAAKIENTLEESARALQAGGQADVKLITKQAELLKLQQEQLQSFKPNIPLTGTQIARMVDTMGLGRASQAVRHADRLGWDMLTSHIYFAQLSNPRTWQVNTGVSTFLMPLYQAASIGLGSRLKPKVLASDAVQAGELARYYPGAAEAHLVGALDGFNTAISHITDSWKGGGLRGLLTDLRNLSPLPRSTAESLPAINVGPNISAENLNRFFANHEKLSWAQFDPNGIFKPAAQLLDAYGEGAHFVRQAMEGGDRLAYLVNEHAHRGSQAFSRAVEQGLTGDELIKYYKNQIANPTGLVQKAAQKGGMHDIFREEVTGTTGSIVRGLGHPMWRVPITYVRTPLNIASIGLEGFPGLNRLVSHVRGDYEAGGARAQLATGRWMVGSLIAGTAATMAVGNRLTGYGPLDPQGREAWLATNEPYAFRIRDTGDKKRDWISYKFLQPFSTWMGMVADFTQMKAIEHTPEKAMEYMWAPVVAFQHSLSNTIFTEDLFRLMDALHIRPHQNQEQWAQSVSKYMENRAKSVIPPASAGLKALYSAIDPVSKEIVGIGDALKAGIPGWSSTMKPDLDYFGQEQKYGAAYNMLMTPIRETDTKYDKVTNEIARNQPNLLNIPSIVDKTELTSADKYNFKNIRGNEVKLFGGKKFGEALLDLVNSEKYQKGTEGPHGMRAKLLSTYVGAYTKAAIAQMAKKDPRFYNMLSEFENMDELTGKKVQRPGIFRMQPQ